MITVLHRSRSRLGVLNTVPCSAIGPHCENLGPHCHNTTSRHHDAVYRGLSLQVVAGFVNCFLGADMLLKSYGRWIVLAWVVVLVAIFLIMNAIEERERDRGSAGAMIDRDDAKRLAISQSSTSLTMAEVRAAVRGGSKWAIIEGWVYDIGPIIRSHPGGAFLLERSLGADISAFFSGREAFDAHIRPHPHSERARKLLRSMCVAALKSDLEIKNWAEAPSMPDDACTDSWTLVRRTVLRGDYSRPIIKLEFAHDSATATPALEWAPSSFGR